MIQITETKRIISQEEILKLVEEKYGFGKQCKQYIEDLTGVGVPYSIQIALIDVKSEEPKAKETEGFGKYDPPKNPSSFDHSPKIWAVTVRDHTKTLALFVNFSIKEPTFNEALHTVLGIYHIEDIVSLELIQND